MTSGGQSKLNLWAPVVGTGEIRSTSQHWYIGGTGGNLQVVECGWQVYPHFYGDHEPHLFTYWTADNYNATGCYDLTCDAFVQSIDPPIALGWPIGPVSEIGGEQFQIGLTFYHTGGRWWLYWHGARKRLQAIGYYPDTLFGGALTYTTCILAITTLEAKRARTGAPSEPLRRRQGLTEYSSRPRL